MKQIKMLGTLWLQLVVLMLILYSCSPMDEYLDKYTDRKEKQYTGIVNPAMMYSGENRVVFVGYLMSDPKISQIKIYWNERQDSLLRDIERTDGIDELIIPIALPEGGYNFEVFTFDKEGNSSIPVYLSATSYGAAYKELLKDRLIKNLVKDSSNVYIEWYSADPTSPFVEITYPLQDGGNKTIRVSPDSTKVTLVNYKRKSTFSMKTFYLPDEMAIDTFKTDGLIVPVNEDVTKDYILNAGLPFLRADNGTGKWGIIKDWFYTPNVLNQDNNAKGGWSTNGNPSGVLHLESRNYTGDGITNGKVYQSMNLPAGKYIFESYSWISSTTKNSFLDVALVASSGNQLPDLESVEANSLGFYRRQVATGSENYRFEFEINEDLLVSLGWVASFGKTSAIQFTHVKLYYIPQN